MARPLRIERVGGWYHVTGRGNERRPIFRDNRDRQHFCELLAEWVSRFQVRLHAVRVDGQSLSSPGRVERAQPEPGGHEG